VVLIKAVLQAMPLYLFSILAVPKLVIKRIKDLQRNFLWGSTATNHKWALVNWTTVCMSKEKGGIGLRDPNQSNAIMCAKLWWQWLSNTDKPWATIWIAKYANYRPQKELIRLIPNAKGSLIWNAAKQHYMLIQHHNFWEVRNGETARFWTDAWNQMPKLSSILHPLPSCIGEEKQQQTIKQHWTQENAQGYRQWIQSDRIPRNVELSFRERLERELQNRHIRHSEGKDILRWGYKPKGAFTTSKVYKLINSNLSPPDLLWGKIWDSGIWPKVSLFLWLVGHQKILTWDRLRRINYHGPSMCVNCKAQEETLQHLFDSCAITNQLWEKVSFRCQRRCRVAENIINTLCQWKKKPFKSEILNHLWKIIPGLLVWGIWMEIPLS